MNLFKIVIAAFGWKTELAKVNEEMAELTKEIWSALKFSSVKEIAADLRNRIIEELVDVFLVLNYVIIIFDIKEEELERWYIKKEQKLQNALIKHLQEKGGNDTPVQ